MADVALTTDGLSLQEAAIVDIVRLNKAVPRKEVRREGQLMGWRFVYTRRFKDNLWGRFGGGWNWKLGADIGGCTIILNLLVASVRIERKRK
jgi:hypothetical protein